MRMLHTVGLSVLVALSAPAALHAQAARPNFAGTFALDPAQSDGPRVPSKMTMVITQSATEIVVNRTQTGQNGENTVTLKYALGGGASKNELNFGGNAVPVSTVVSFAADTAVLTNTLSINGNDVQQVDKWALGDGGKKLTVVRSFNMNGEAATSKLVLVKQ